MLPKIFKNTTGNPEFDQHNGKFYISYSQLTSYLDETYWMEYFTQYFSGIKSESGEFAEFGTIIGQTIEQLGQNQEVTTEISREDLEIIKATFNFEGDNKYEDTCIIDFGDFILIGYADKVGYFHEEKAVEVLDVKTLNLDKKADYYASKDYRQTTLYSYYFETKGYKIKDSFVLGYGRKGSSLDGQGNFKMRLSGDVKKIPTPYSKERAEEALKYVRETAKKISEDWKIYQRLFV